MKSSKRGDALRKLLALCDDLHRIHRKMSDPELRRDMRTRLHTQSRKKSELLEHDLSTYRFRGPIGKLMRELRLSSAHFQVLAVLLHRHLRCEDPACEGRLILASVFDSTFDVLAGTSLLTEVSPLRSSGLIMLEEDEERCDDVLEARFQLSEEALSAFRDEVTGGVPEDTRGLKGAYGNARDFLVDLRVLHNLYRMRAERVFNQDRWDRVHVANRNPGEGLSRRIDTYWRKVQRKLTASEAAGDFPVVRL